VIGVAALDRSVLAEVVDADDLVPVVEELGNQVAADEPGRAREEDSQS
jgi:hypothetical protein